MKYFRNHIVGRFLCLLMAVHIFNICVDCPDGQPDYIPENLEVNDMESVAEIVAEEVLDIDNAFEETDERDVDESDVTMVKKFDIVNYRMTILMPSGEIIGKKEIISYKENSFSRHNSEINSPPPQV